MIELLIIVLGSLFVLLVVIFIIAPLFVGASYEPSKDAVLNKMIKLANLKRGAKMAELGSGDGKIVISFARQGIRADGFEINPILVWWSRRKIRKEKLENCAKIYWKSFWNVDFGKYDVVTSFQVFYVMGKLKNKLRKELKKGAKVISNQWKFKNWKIEKSLGKVYLYVND